MSKVKVGDVLVHPIHGEMTVTNVDPFEYEEFIPELRKFEKGFKVETVFDKFIPVVKWSTMGPLGKKVSKLMFHSYYLKNVKLKGENDND